MNKIIVQESGYRIGVTSWENDGDHYNFQSITVGTKEEARVVVELCNLLRPSYRTGLPDYGNMYEPSESDLADFEQAIAAIPDIKEFLHKTFPSLEQDMQDPEYGAGYMDCVMQVLYDLGLSGSEYYFTRVCDKIEVHYFDEPVYAEDVTLEVQR